MLLLAALLPSAAAGWEAETQDVLSELLSSHWRPLGTAFKELLGTVTFLSDLRCEERTWCASVPRLRSLLLSDPWEILRRLLGSQNPEDCAQARYLVWHDDRTTSGFGWTSYLLFRAFLQAYIENRVLVEAAAVDPSQDRRWRQHWCSDPPFSLKCYFRSWSSCERPSALTHASGGLAALPEWQPGSVGQACSCNATAVLWRTSSRSDASIFPGLVSRGRFWWYAAMVRVLMQPLPWLQTEADNFLRKSQLEARPFVVAAVRRGNKSSETALVGIEEFTNQLRRMNGLYGVSDVLIQTESQSALDELQSWCGWRGLRLHYTRNRRPGMDVFSSKYGPAGANLTEEGRVAVLNLLVGSRALAVLGSFHSAWLKIMPAFMIAYQWRAVLVVGLAGQDHWTMGSYTGAEAAAQQLLQPGELFADADTSAQPAAAALLQGHPGLSR